ncbi:hypothetical protein ACWD11_15140 [Streptomyces sp. NPDC002776]
MNDLHVVPSARIRHGAVRALSCARGLGARGIETVVLAANTDGLRFAEARGFVEVERYVAPEDETEVWLTLRLEG